MTIPGPRTTPVRRTVIVAVSLVTGQALLGAVIGFVTFDRDDGAPVAPRAADVVAAPPIVVPAPSLPVPSRSSRAPRKRAAAEVSTSIRRTVPPPAEPTETETERPRTSTAPRPATTAPEPAPSSTPPPPAPPPTALLPPEYDAPPDDTPVIRERCDEEGATGRTDDGRAVRCERDRDGDLRWRPV